MRRRKTPGRLTPGVLDAPGSPYATYFARVAFLDAVRTHVEAAPADLFDRVTTPGLTAPGFFGAVEEWAQRWHLADPWARAAAIVAAAYWVQHPTSRHDAAVWAASCGVPVWHGVDEPEAWDPTVESLERYGGRVIAATQAAGAPRARIPTAPEHFTWLALYQVGGMGWTALAARVGRDARVVQTGCQRLAKVIGLKTLRTGTHSRPRQ